MHCVGLLNALSNPPGAFLPHVRRADPVFESFLRRLRTGYVPILESR